MCCLDQQHPSLTTPENPLPFATCAVRGNGAVRSNTRVPLLLRQGKEGVPLGGLAGQVSHKNRQEQLAGCLMSLTLLCKV